MRHCLAVSVSSWSVPGRPDPTDGDRPLTSTSIIQAQAPTPHLYRQGPGQPGPQPLTSIGQSLTSIGQPLTSRVPLTSIGQTPQGQLVHSTFHLGDLTSLESRRSKWLRAVGCSLTCPGAARALLYFLLSGTSLLNGLDPPQTLKNGPGMLLVQFSALTIVSDTDSSHLG